MSLLQQKNYYQYFGFNFSMDRKNILAYFRLRKKILEGFLETNSLDRRCRRMAAAEIVEMDSATNYAFASDILRDKYDKRLLKQFSDDVSSIECFSQPGKKKETALSPFIHALRRTFNDGDTSNEACELRKNSTTSNPDMTKALDICLIIGADDLWQKDQIWVSFSIFGLQGGYSHSFIPIYGTAEDAIIQCSVTLAPDIDMSKGANIYIEVINRTKGITLYCSLRNYFVEAMAAGLEKAQEEQSRSIDEEKLQECLDELEALTGLDCVKEDLKRFIAIARGQIIEREMGYPVESAHLNMAFVGNPGTGKTTVARIYAKMLDALGLIRGASMKAVSATDLVGRYIGETGPKTRQLCENAYGGVLFIDEAYQLYNRGGTFSNTNSFNDEAVTELVRQMEDNADKLVIVLAGYIERMDQLFEHGNPGLKSRIGKTIVFEDYSTEDLLLMCKKRLADASLRLADEAEAKLMLVLLRKQQDAGATFGNAREARTVAKEIIANRQVRIANEGGKSESFNDRTIHEEDVPDTF